MTYKVYSLEKPPRLLPTITGGDWFSAADTKLEGRTEIWTSDTVLQKPPQNRQNPHEYRRFFNPTPENRTQN